MRCGDGFCVHTNRFLFLAAFFAKLGEMITSHAVLIEEPRRADVALSFIEIALFEAYPTKRVPIDSNIRDLVQICGRKARELNVVEIRFCRSNGGLSILLREIEFRVRTGQAKCNSVGN